MRNQKMFYQLIKESNFDMKKYVNKNGISVVRGIEAGKREDLLDKTFFYYIFLL